MVTLPTVRSYLSVPTIELHPALVVSPAMTQPVGPEPASAHPVVAAVLVSFNSGERIERTAAAAVDQVDRAVVVDNGSDIVTLSALNRLRAAYPDQVEVIELGRNLGLGAALNKGIERALSYGADYVLTLDDDSELAPGSVAQLVECAEREHGRVGIAVARWVTPVSAGPSEDCFLDRAPSGGSLVRRTVFERIGLLRADYFIDFVDYEFCARVRAHGWLIQHCSAATVLQRPGHPVRRRVLRREVDVSNYPPDRLYYMTRNGIVLYLWEQRNVSFLAEHARAMATRALKIVLFEQFKWRKLWSICRGVSAGLRRSLGES